MDMEFKEAAAPSLTLDPFKEAETAQMVVAEEPETVEEPVLTPEEQQMVDAFAQQIDLNDSTAILQYGAGTRRRWRTFPRRLSKK